jgi:hypothetical protein
MTKEAWKVVVLNRWRNLCPSCFDAAEKAACVPDERSWPVVTLKLMAFRPRKLPRLSVGNGIRFESSPLRTVA